MFCVCVCLWCRLLQLTSAFTGRSIHWGRSLWSPLISSIRCLFSHWVKRLLNSHIFMALNASSMLLLTHFVWQHQADWAAAVQCPVCCRWHTEHTFTNCWKHTFTSCWSSPSLFARRLISSANHRFDRHVPDTLTPDSQLSSAYAITTSKSMLNSSGESMQPCMTSITVTNHSVRPPLTLAALTVPPVTSLIFHHNPETS